MFRILKRVWELPPKETLSKAKRILNGKRGLLDLDEIVNTPRLMRSQRFYDFFSRYEAILKRTCGWEEIDFVGKRVLEIGCGPQLGFGPLALFRGAESFSSMDPGYDPSILDAKIIVERYFLQIHKDLSAVYGVDKGFVEFMNDLKTRTHVVAEPLIGTRLKGPFDVIISNSCLEHVFDFEDSMKVLFELSAPDCRFLHLVDFSNHRGTHNPFDDLYSEHPDVYLKKHDDAINLLRAPDILSAMKNAGFDVEISTYTSYPEFYKGSLDTYWSDRYSEEELFLRTAIYHNTVPGKN
jgi:SAM-dependent methyltransferase